MQRSVTPPVHAKPDAALSASVSTADGTTWTLPIPEGPILAPIDISITAFAEVHAKAGSVEPVSGVLLQPTGLQFAIPARLIAESSDAIDFDLVTTNNDGSQVEPVIREDNGGAATRSSRHSIQASTRKSIR